MKNMIKRRVIVTISMFLFLVVLFSAGYFGFHYVNNHLNKDSFSRSRFQHDTQEVSEVSIIEKDGYFLYINKPVIADKMAVINQYVDYLTQHFISQSKTSSMYLSLGRIDYQIDGSSIIFYLDRNIDNLTSNATYVLNLNQPELVDANQTLLNNSAYVNYFEIFNQNLVANQVIISEDQLQYANEKPKIVTEKYIALTFNQSSHVGNYEALLNSLNEYKAKITFFVLGNQVQEQSDLIKQMVDNGHQLGNLGYDFTDFESLSCEQITHQLDETQSLVNEITAVPLQLVRAPYGAFNETIGSCIDAPLVNWDTDSEDWRDLATVQIYDNLQRTMRPGTIVLFSSLNDNTLEAVKLLLVDLSRKGYQFVTVNQLYSLYGKHLVKHHLHSSVLR